MRSLKDDVNRAKQENEAARQEEIDREKLEAAERENYKSRVNAELELFRQSPEYQQALAHATDERLHEAISYLAELNGFKSSRISVTEIIPPFKLTKYSSKVIDSIRSSKAIISLSFLTGGYHSGRHNVWFLPSGEIVPMMTSLELPSGHHINDRSYDSSITVWIPEKEGYYPEKQFKISFSLDEFYAQIIQEIISKEDHIEEQRKREEEKQACIREDELKIANIKTSEEYSFALKRAITLCSALQSKNKNQNFEIKDQLVRMLPQSYFECNSGGVRNFKEEEKVKNFFSGDFVISINDQYFINLSGNILEITSTWDDGGLYEDYLTYWHRFRDDSWYEEITAPKKKGWFR